eukprot:GFKZ01015217.1.p4 GENE.GFKZ01015217.1~~GFKZ01015217.1.p4  ORF type:complete len:122 (-),score=25.41 GFKZ01015217.1:168-533(-)
MYRGGETVTGAERVRYGYGRGGRNGGDGFAGMRRRGMDGGGRVGRMRGRAEPVGVGFGVFVVATAACVLLVGSEFVWRFLNRGKSFEEVVGDREERQQRGKYGVKRMRRRDGAGGDGVSER